MAAAHAAENHTPNHAFYEGYIQQFQPEPTHKIH